MIEKTIKKVLNELTSSRYAGYYNGPLTMGEIDWDDSSMGPFTNKVSKYFNSELEYDSYDGSLDSHKKDRKKLESKSRRISKYNKTHKQFNDEDGNPINATPGKGKKIVPIVGEWVELDKLPLNEDLAVWFGTKKKPKGSKQPKGPWVNICRKVDGKHPPCGRSNTDKGGYPKCRAVGVAGKMSDSQKKAACQQKRNAEKKDTQSGKGQKPVMTSYKPKKKINENMKKVIRLTENDLIKIIKQVLKEQKQEPLISENQQITLTCQEYKLYTDEVTKKKKIKLYSKYNISGDLSTDSKVLQGESFTDVGHLPGEPWGTGFESKTGSDYGLSFYVDETNKPSPLNQAFGSSDTNKLQRFDLIPITQEYKDFIGDTNSGDHMIFHLEGGRKQGFCVISSNTPSEEFKNELSSNWGLNNDLF